MKGLAEGLKALGPARLGAMAAVAAGMLGLLLVLGLRGGSQPMSLLYGDLDLREAGQITDQLDRAHIPHREEAEGSRIMVPADAVTRARLLLAQQGLPSGGSIGYEIFDRGDGLTATGFQQQINETRALEGELSRTIGGMSGVRAVRVHLVLPRREPFAREQQEAQASVMLTMTGLNRMDKEGVQAVLNLVAAAVPGLKPQNVAIIDSRGTVLSRAGQPTGPDAAAQTEDEVRQATELRLSRAVEEMLERTVGPGKVRAEAAVEMDFDQTHETDERYDPDQQVVRSTQTVTDNSKTTEAANSVSVQNNLPNANAGNAENAGGTQEQRQEETTNYEIGKTVRTLVHDHPQIHRISLAVLLDGSETVGTDGKPVWHERTPEELARITALVRSAIGYDEKRGDHVEVVNMRFAAPDQIADAPAPGLLGLGLEKADIMRLVETALFGVIAVLALLLVLRPMVIRLAPPAAAALSAAGEAGMALGAAGVAALAGPGGTPALAGPAGRGPALLEDDRMLDIANIEGQMRASSIRRIADLVEKHPEESLSIVRNWMLQEGS
jgi:flagellar M-ring protein FliF